MTDEELVRQLMNPETRRAAFEVMVKQYSEPLYWKIRHIVVNHEDADDILQNVFMKAWSNMRTFENRSKLSTWLYRIAVNQCLDFLRKQNNNPQISAEEVRGLSSRLLADEYFDGDELQAKLRAVVASLPDAQRIIFNMRYFDDMKYKDIALALNRSEGTIKASYHIAVQKIVDFFHKHD